MTSFRWLTSMLRVEIGSIRLNESCLVGCRLESDDPVTSLRSSPVMGEPQKVECARTVDR